MSLYREWGQESLYSEVEVEQILTYWGGGFYTVKSKLNNFEHVGGLMYHG